MAFSPYSPSGSLACLREKSIIKFLTVIDISRKCGLNLNWYLKDITWLHLCSIFKKYFSIPVLIILVLCEQELLTCFLNLCRKSTSQLPTENVYPVPEDGCSVTTTDWHFGFHGLFNRLSLLHPSLWGRGFQSPIKFWHPDHMYMFSNLHNPEHE